MGGDQPPEIGHGARLVRSRRPKGMQEFTGWPWDEVPKSGEDLLFHVLVRRDAAEAQQELHVGEIRCANLSIRHELEPPAPRPRIPPGGLEPRPKLRPVLLEVLSPFQD